MKKVKKYGNIKCILEYNFKAKLLILEYWKKGKIIYRTYMPEMTKSLSNRIILDFDKKMAFELYNLNAEII